MIRSYKYRINPNSAQASALNEMLRDFCQLYNAALEERIGAWRRGIAITYYDQTAHLPGVRRDIPGQGRWSANAQQQVLRRLNKTYQAFFGRVRRGAKAGFPRFRASARYHSADFRVGDGLTIRRSGKLGFVGVPGEIKVRWHRELPSKPKTAILTRQAGKWYILFHVDVFPVERAAPESVGVDMGLTSLMALSNGETVARPGWTKHAAKGLRKRQRAVARCKRGSKTRRKRVAALAAYHARVGNRRRDHHHKLSRDLVNRFGRIAVENLNIKGLAAGMLAKHVHDAAWAQIVSMLRYKAESAGCEFIEVDPRGTSQTCPECGTIAAKPLSAREHRCECGCSLDRDVAAAKIVHLRAFGFVPGTGIGQITQWVAA